MMDDSLQSQQDDALDADAAMNAVGAMDDQDGCAKCEDYLAGWKRAQADYQNLKRQSELDKVDFSKYANERLLMELLPAIDQFGIALNYIPSTELLPEDQRKIWDNWLIGIRAVRSLWDTTATSVGLERVPTEGVFDPVMHDAVGEEEGSEKASGMIVRVMQDGWKLHGKVLRPARVILAK